MTNNPDKRRRLSAHGVRIAGQEPVVTSPHREAVAYLAAKRARLNHELDAPELTPKAVSA